MDCRQANTQGPVDFDFQFLAVPDACCNIHTPVQDNDCKELGWPGYGPSANRGEDKTAAFIVNVTEGECE